MSDITPSNQTLVPLKGITGALDVEDMRNFIWDRTIEDNPIELDLSFSDTEIGHAFRFAALQYNSIPPYIGTIRGPGDVTDNRLTYSVLLAVAYHLFLAKAAQLSRQDIDYTAGNMTVDFTKRRIEYLTKWAKAFKDESMQGMQAYKLMVNINSGFAAM